MSGFKRRKIGVEDINAEFHQIPPNSSSEPVLKFHKWKNCQQTDIIWVLVWSMDPPFTKTNGAFAVAKNSMSLVN